MKLSARWVNSCVGSVFLPRCGHGGLLFAGQPVVAGVRKNGRLDDDRVQRAAAIFHEYDGFIRAIIRFQAHDRSAEEDLFQEFFLAMIRRPVPVEVRNIKSYLYRAVVNHILDSVRMQENYEHAVKKYAWETRISINNRPARNVLIDDPQDRNSTLAFFARHLQKREAQALVLRYRDDCSIGEIAASMGVNARTVSRYLSKGIRKLRQTLVP